MYFAEPDGLAAPTAIPNDPRFTDQWHLLNTGQSNGWVGADIKATPAWDILSSAPNVVVAIFDSGVCSTHTDISPNLWTNPNGGTFLHGINAIPNPATGNIEDDYGHGSTIAGAIGAVGNNGLGISGVAWQTKMMICKCMATNGTISESDVLECLNFAIPNGANVVNMSFASVDFGQSTLEAVATARNFGIIVSAAAGNFAYNNDSMKQQPASIALDNIISTAASTRWDNYGGGSYGPLTVDLFAPGQDILTTDRWPGTYVWTGGSSLSTALVTGALALMKQRFPFASYCQLENRLLASATPGYWLPNLCATGARLNLANAVTPSLITAPPFNDNFNSAAPLGSITNSRVTTAVNNVDATKEAGEPNHAGNIGGKSLWWKWTPTSATPITLTTDGSAFDTLLAVYTGTSLNNLVLVVSDDDSAGNYASRVTFTPVLNTTYYVAVDGKNGACGTLKLKMSDAFWPVLGNLRFVLGPTPRIPGQFQTSFFGRPSSSVRVDTSTDLFSWSLCALLNLDANGQGNLIDMSANDGCKFYRATIISGSPQWSFNIVGYVDKLNLPSGESWIANPLVANDNRVPALFPGVPTGTRVSKWNESSQSYVNNYYNGSWTDPNMTVQPGEGMVFYNPSGTPLTVRFAGEIKQGYNNNSAPNLWSMRSSIVPLAGLLVRQLGFPVLGGDSIVKKQNGVEVTYTFSGGIWSPSEPVLALGESFRSYKNVGLAWYRNFVIWPACND